MRTVILDRNHPGYEGPQLNERMRRRQAGHLAARLLAERSVFCEWRGETVVFAIGAHTCFEELDWVQAAASELLQ